MKRLVPYPILFIIFFFNIRVFAQSYVINSPDLNIQFQISVGEEISYAIIYRGGVILDRSTFALKFNQAPLFGKQVSVTGSESNTVNETWQPVAGSFAEVRNHYNEMILHIEEDKFPKRVINLVIRAYNDGVAFRYRIPQSWARFIPTYEDRDWILLEDEESQFVFQSGFTTWAADYGEYDTHQEEAFDRMLLKDISGEAVVGLPLLIRVHDRLYTAITEADLADWAGMYLRKNPGPDLTGTATLITDLSPHPEGTGKVRIKPGTASPWRVIMLGESPGALIESQLIPNLNDPCAIEDPSWIEPGISAWDHWWSGEVQMNTETIKKYIRLASDMGWEYMLIDWHWYGPPFTLEGEWRANPEADITTVNPAVDMPEVIQFAEQHNVKLLLWLLWNHVDKQMEEAFPLYEKWGIAGVKIDFMARDDQEMVNWYHRVVKKAAEHKLLVNFHGAYKPTGWSRTWPNLVTREGVLGNEYSKWSSRITPDHNVTLPFTRMLAGQMDYTPGAFLNVTPKEFRNGSPAQVMNTRAHQLAMFVVYYSPLTVACDHPDHYAGEPGIEFLQEVPTTWDDTRVLTGEVGDYIVMARKKGDRWYLGAMGDSEARGVTVKLDFLTEGNYDLTWFRDAPDSDEEPKNIEIGSEKIKGGQYYYIKMAPGGGFAGWID